MRQPIFRPLRHLSNTCKKTLFLVLNFFTIYSKKRVKKAGRKRDLYLQKLEQPTLPENNLAEPILADAI